MLFLVIISSVRKTFKLYAKESNLFSIIYFKIPKEGSMIKIFERILNVNLILMTTLCIK